MIDTEMLLKRYQRGELDQIRDSLALLSQMGVFVAQAHENKQRILERFDRDDPAKLAEEILEVRQTNRDLLALHELGRTMKDESNAQS